MIDPFDRSIPGYSELIGWPKKPLFPEQITEICLYRDGTVVVVVSGDIEFFFERSLGRLCYGQSHTDEAAAFIKKGSSFESELYAYLEAARIRLSADAFAISDIKLFNDCFARAKTYAGV